MDGFVLVSLKIDLKEGGFRYKNCIFQVGYIADYCRLGYDAVCLICGFQRFIGISPTS